MANRPKTLAILLGLALATACSRSSKPEPWYIEGIQLSQTTLEGNPALGMGVDDLRERLIKAFNASNKFVPVAEARGKASEARTLQSRLEVAFTRESVAPEGGRLVNAEVGVVMDLKRAGEFERFQATGMGRATFNADEPAARVPSFRKALEQALQQVVEAQVLQLAALEKPDAALIADMEASDPRVREFAARALAERRTPAAVPALIKALGDSDREVSMRAVSALGAIKDERAVPALIELSSHRDTQFQISLIDVIASIGGLDAEGYLFTISSGHSDAAVRRAALEASQRVEKRAQAPESPTRTD